MSVLVLPFTPTYFNSMRTLFLAVASCAAFTAATAMGGDLTEEKFQQLHAELVPTPDEPWRTIPWKIDLLDAQQEAAREHKPIFIWAMDGHPLGCT